MLLYRLYVYAIIYTIIGSMQIARVSVLWGVGKKQSALVSFLDRFPPFYVVNYSVTYRFHNGSTGWLKEDLAQLVKFISDDLLV